MPKERIGLYPGTFDPITNGHVDIIERTLKIVDKLVVGVAINAEKRPLFSVEERVEMVRREVEPLSRQRDVVIEIRPFETLLMHFAMEVNAGMILRGLRAVSDFEYEFQMVGMNARLNPDIETVFLMASDKHQFIASSLVKVIARLGGDVSKFVSASVTEQLKEKYRAESRSSGEGQAEQ